MLRYCKKCRRETRHRKLEKSFLADLAVAVITGLRVDLRQPDYECNDCGRKV